MLDWGLGHATRCIPIVHALIEKNCRPILASNGRAYELLKKQFPELKLYRLSSYNPQYPRGKNMVWKMAMQLPKFGYTIWREHREIEKIVARENIDAVISDNRYNCYSTKVKSVFMTHQTHVLMPDGHAWLEEQVNTLNRSFIRQYAECWIPAPDENLLQELCDSTAEYHKRFIGFLSDMKREEKQKKYDVCVVCSGPEPQRTLFENVVSAQLKTTELRYIVVRGKPEALNPVYSNTANQQVVNFLNTSSLAEVINESKIVIARSGYSMIMDLAKLQAKAIFIPTPGQTEQEHLAKKLMDKKIALAIPQQDFELAPALQQAEQFSGFNHTFAFDQKLLHSALDSLLC